jgi:hypothetical protein
MSKLEGKPSRTGTHKHQEARYMKLLKEKQDERETRDKLLAIRNASEL